MGKIPNRQKKYKNNHQTNVVLLFTSSSGSRWRMSGRVIKRLLFKISFFSFPHLSMSKHHSFNDNIDRNSLITEWQIHIFWSMQYDKICLLAFVGARVSSGLDFPMFKHLYICLFFMLIKSLSDLFCCLWNAHTEAWRFDKLCVFLILTSVKTWQLYYFLVFGWTYDRMFNPVPFI